jgi:uncharacterized protein
MKNRILTSVFTIACFLLAYYSFDIIRYFGLMPDVSRTIRTNAYQIGAFGLFPILIIGLRYGFSNIVSELGLESNKIGMGCIVAFICTLPMLIGYGVLANFDGGITLIAALSTAVIAPICEEIIFRGFLFRQLYHHAGWKFIMVTIVNGLIFGFAHISQGHTPMESLGVFGITFVGGAFFSWVYRTWGYNLWLTIFLHSFMNFSWHYFSMADNALGGTWANILRCATILLVVFATIMHKRGYFLAQSSSEELKPLMD